MFPFIRSGELPGCYYRSFWNAFQEREHKESTTLSLRRNQLVLENFLREAMSQGLTKTDITLYCCMNGWSDLEIEDSWEILSDENDG